MTISVRLESAGVLHTAVLADLYAQCFEEAWSTGSMAAAVVAPGAFAAIALHDRDGAAFPVGFALARHTGDEAELIAIGVPPAHRGRGIGAMLLREVIRCAQAGRARRLLLEVAETNDAARALYAAHGFRAVGRRPDYYQRANRIPIAALTMALDLVQTSRPGD